MPPGRRCAEAGKPEPAFSFCAIGVPKACICLTRARASARVLSRHAPLAPSVCDRRSLSVLFSLIQIHLGLSSTGAPMISPRRRLILIAFLCTLLTACASPKPLDTTALVAPETLARAKGGDGSALGALRDAADNGSGSAEYTIGLGLAEGWAGKKDLEQALMWWQQAAEHGDADAKNALAVAYAEGLNGPSNLDAARRLWEEAAEH